MSPAVHQSAGRPDGGQFTSPERPEATNVRLRAGAVTPPPGYFGQTQDELTAMPADQMSPVQVQQWSEGELSHCISPAVGRLRLAAHRGLDTSGGFDRLDKAYTTAGASIADKFGRGIVRDPMVGPDADDRLERLQLKPGADMDAEEIKGWVVLELRERLTPLRDRMTQEAKAGEYTADLSRDFIDTAMDFSSDVAAKFRPTANSEERP